MSDIKHIVLFSGGLGSYFTTKRLIESGVDKDSITLLFTDTKVEDEDLYRFMSDASNFLDIPITNYSDGRTIWQVFKDRKFLGNNRADPCSKELKRFMSRKYIKQYSPKQCIIYLGFDWTEAHRLDRARKAWLPYKVESPLCNPPYKTKQELQEELKQDGLTLPRLYRMGFSHNNCGGGCVKAGIGHFTMLLDRFPERFYEWEQNEQEIREYLDRDVSMLKRTRNGITTTFTLKQLREERESITQEELFDIGGCNCFID